MDVAEDAAGADRSELLIIADQSDVRAAPDGELGGGVGDKVSANVECTPTSHQCGMPASSMITRVDGPTAAAHSGRSP